MITNILKIMMNRKIISGILCLISIPALAIDNPDAPDYVGEFEARMQKHETYLYEMAKTTQDYLEGYAAYEKDLDSELDRAYQLLMSNLAAEQQELLKQSQRDWIKYRDSEFSFITNNWTTEQFGTSSAISRGNYRTMLIKNRVITLLSYLLNY